MRTEYLTTTQDSILSKCEEFGGLAANVVEMVLELDAKLSKKEDEISALENKIGELEGQIEELNQEISNLNQQIEP